MERGQERPGQGLRGRWHRGPGGQAGRKWTRQDLCKSFHRDPGVTHQSGLSPEGRIRALSPANALGAEAGLGLFQAAPLGETPAWTASDLPRQ